MSDTASEKAFYQYLPPRPETARAFDKATTAVTADRTALWANIGAPKGWVQLEFENRDATDSIYFNLTTTDSGAGATTADTGWKLGPGQHVQFWVNPKIDVYVDWLASANTPVLKWRVCSHPFNRLDP